MLKIMVKKIFTVLRRKFLLIYIRLFRCNCTCYCVNMVSVMSASRYIMSASGCHLPYQSRSSMYIHDLFPRNFVELAEVERSGRVLDSRPRGRGFEPHRSHCVVVLEQDTFILA